MRRFARSRSDRVFHSCDSVVRMKFGQAHLRKNSNICIASLMASLKKCFRGNSAIILCLPSFMYTADKSSAI